MFNRKALLICAFALSASLVGCKTNTDSNVISVVFVPSRDASDLTASAAKLEPILNRVAKSKGYNYTFDISTSTDYSAATTALVGDTADIAFLTGTSYAAATVDYPGKVDLLLTARRDGYKVQTVDVPNPDNTEAGRKAQVDAMNGGDVNGKPYVYRGEQDSTNPADSYNSILLANKSKGVQYVDDLLGKTVGIQGPQSGAGYNYPKLFLGSMKDEATRKIWFKPDSPYLNNDYIKEHGITIVSGKADPEKGEIQGQQISGYDSALTELMNTSSQFAAVWGFNDIRYANGYNKSGSKWYQDASIFTDTVTVAMTIGIYNDTISARHSLEDDKKKATIEAFKGAVADGTKDQKGSGAQIIYDIYSHTGYVDGVDANYEAEREIYKANKANQ